MAARVNSEDSEVKCIVCYFSIDDGKESITFDCGCVVCLHCMMTNLKTNRINGYRNLECLSCAGSERNEEQEKRILSQLRLLSLEDEAYTEIFDKFEISLKSSVLQGKNMTYCAHPPCTACQPRDADKNRTMRCKACKKKTCHDCKLPWHRQHKNTKCEVYKVWVQKNMPEWYIPQELEKACFICPNCNAQFEMVRGGCLHFDCPSCKTAFCGFCQQTFHSPKRNPCPICGEDERKGMHAHHPRICPYFLRDREVDWLWELVEQHGQKMDDLLPMNKRTRNGKCRLMYRTDRGSSKSCRQPVEERCQGLCSRHFRESVSFAIFHAKSIDPIVLMTREEMRILADREKMAVDVAWDEAKLRAFITKKLPVTVVLEDPFFTCPRCKSKASIVRGGSCHFECRQCFFPSCGFCRQPVYSPGQLECPVCPAGSSRGVHAHHHRCCPYFLRDKDVDWFYDLLEVTRRGGGGAGSDRRCSLQKHEREVATFIRHNGAAGEQCGFRFHDGSARRICSSPRDERCLGYCARHFQQLMGEAVLAAKDIEPCVMMNDAQLRTLLNRECVPFDADADTEQLRLIVDERLPLTRANSVAPSL